MTLSATLAPAGTDQDQACRYALLDAIYEEEAAKRDLPPAGPQS